MSSFWSTEAELLRETEARHDGQIRLQRLPVRAAIVGVPQLAVAADDVAVAGIAKPQDLKGKKVGVPEYPVAAIVWIRDALESKYGVRPQDIRWVEERTPKQSHYRGAGYAPPAGVPVEPIPAGRNLAGMLIAGELDAVIRYLEKPKQMSLAELGAQPSVKWLYPDRKAEGIAHCKAQGYFDPIHLMIMKKSIADAILRESKVGDVQRAYASNIIHVLDVVALVLHK